MTIYLDAYQPLDQCLTKRMQAAHNPALVMALTGQDRLIRLTALGHADLESKAPIRPDHLFAIGSIGKAFTAVAVLQACEAKLLDVRAPVKHFLPWFEVQSTFPPITIHHLLTHSSGLPRGTDFSPDPRAEVYALRDQEVGFAPGKHFSYSDLGYKVLGLVLQAVTGKPYAQLIREQILEPLEMDQTFAATTHDLRPRMAQGYRYLFDDRPSHPSQPLIPAPWVETDSADGCIVSTAEDMARFARMLLNEGDGPNGRVISEMSYRKMAFPMIEDDGEAYSYGLYLFDDDGYRYAGHGGDVPGYESYMWMDLDNCIGTVVLMTTPHTPRASFLAADYFRAVYLGQTLPEMPSAPNFTHVGKAADYAGTYRAGSETVTLVAEGHHLFIVDGDHRVIMEERGPDTFYANHPGWDRYLLRFERVKKDGPVAEIFYGPQWFTNDHYQGPAAFDNPPEWQAYAGHYRSHNPWDTNFSVFPRKGQLIFSHPAGDEEILSPLGRDTFRIGEEAYIPERLVFDQVVDGQALRAVRSGCPYYRFFTP